VNSQVWWYVARSSGIVAWALLSASVVWGLLLSTKISTTRLAARRLRPAWLLDLHRHLGGLAVIFTAIHIIGIVADSYVTFSWADVFVPMASQWRPGAVAFGVVAMYLLVAVEATSLAIRHLPRPLWRWMHRSSFVLYATATWHGISAGTDAGNQWFRAAAWTSVVLVVALTIRLVLVLRSRSSRSEPARVRAVVPPPPLPASSDGVDADDRPGGAGALVRCDPTVARQRGGDDGPDDPGRCPTRRHDPSSLRRPSRARRPLRPPRPSGSWRPPIWSGSALVRPTQAGSSLRELALDGAGADPQRCRDLLDAAVVDVGVPATRRAVRPWRRRRRCVRCRRRRRGPSPSRRRTPRGRAGAGRSGAGPGWC
jgi:methionine sulfoxide reductase heme-binding subunit